MGSLLRDDLTSLATGGIRFGSGSACDGTKVRGGSVYVHGQLVEADAPCVQ